MKTMTARYPGRCARTGAPINPGDSIIWHGKGKAELLSHAEPVDHDLELARSIDPELAATDPEGASAAGRYLARSMRRGVSDIWSAGGREFYRNKRGRCEDAPCCGCCNA
jgi:hypothetical protein